MELALDNGVDEGHAQRQLRAERRLRRRCYGLTRCNHVFLFPGGQFLGDVAEPDTGVDIQRHALERSDGQGAQQVGAANGTHGDDRGAHASPPPCATGANGTGGRPCH